MPRKHLPARNRKRTKVFSWGAPSARSAIYRYRASRYSAKRPTTNFVSNRIHLVSHVPALPCRSPFYPLCFLQGESCFAARSRIMSVPGTSSNPSRSDELAPRKSTPLRLVFRIIRWSTYAAALSILLMVFHATPPPHIATNPQAAARVEQKVEAVEQAAASGESATLRLDQTEVNSYLASHLEISPAAAPVNPAPNSTPASGVTGASPDLPTPSGSTPEQIEQVRSSVRDVKAELSDDHVLAYVLFDFHGKDITLQIARRLSAANGYLRFQPVSGQLGSLPIPQSSLEAAVQKMMDSPANREKLKLPAPISDLTIENGELLVTYR